MSNKNEENLYGVHYLIFLQELQSVISPIGGLVLACFFIHDILHKRRKLFNILPILDNYGMKLVKAIGQLGILRIENWNYDMTALTH